MARCDVDGRFSYLKIAETAVNTRLTRLNLPLFFTSPEPLLLTKPLTVTGGFCGLKTSELLRAFYLNTPDARNGRKPEGENFWMSGLSRGFPSIGFLRMGFGLGAAAGLFPIFLLEGIDLGGGFVGAFIH